MPRLLVIACGNPLRQDDGAGWRAAGRLLDAPRDADLELEVVTAVQYLPEMAEAVSRADAVVFIDASVDVPAGEASLRPLPLTDASPASLTHHLDAAGLLRLGQLLYGSAPGRAHLLEIGAGAFGLAEAVTPPVERGIELGLELLTGLLAGRQPTGTAAELPR